MLTSPVEVSVTLEFLNMMHDGIHLALNTTPKWYLLCVKGTELAH